MNASQNDKETNVGQSQGDKKGEGKGCLRNMEGVTLLGFTRRGKEKKRSQPGGIMVGEYLLFIGRGRGGRQE